MQVDDLDRRLLELLARDGRRTLTSLAEATGASLSTVRTRVNHLREDGIINIVGICNALVLGHQVVRLLVSVRGLIPNDVARNLTEVSRINHVALIAGSYDIYLEATCHDQAALVDLLDEIRSLPGVGAIQPIVVTSLTKDYTWHGLRGVAGQKISNPDE